MNNTLEIRSQKPEVSFGLQASDLRHKNKFKKNLLIYRYFKFLIIFVGMKSTMLYIWSWRSSTDSAVKQAII